MALVFAPEPPLDQWFVELDDSASRATSSSELPTIPPAAKPTPAAEPVSQKASAAAKPATAVKPAPPVVAAPEPASHPATLLHDSPVRSGQSVIFPQGDVTIIGSVASGSEVVAGGSIHVYGTLRGRAIAGSTGNASARIFCNKLEAELIAIDGLYRTADEMDPQFRSRPVQVWLQGETMAMAALN
jgi:septum site-determining protein MinC